MVEREGEEEEVKVFESAAAFRRWRQRIPEEASIGLLSTKGSIHGGHSALLALAGEMCDYVVTAINVGRTQFPTQEEYTAFPRQITADLEGLREGVDAILALPSEEVCRYGAEHGGKVCLESDLLPRQYTDLPVEQGECTILCKMLNLVRPTHVFIGQRSFVRARMLQRLLDDLLYPVEIVAVPTVRDSNGIAYDARLQLLATPDLVSVRLIYKALKVMVTSYLEDNFDAADLIERGRGTLQTDPAITVNYVRVAHPFGFHDIKLVDPAIGAVAIANVTIGGVVLHDNVLLAKTIPAHEQTLWGLVKSVTKSDQQDDPYLNTVQNR